MPLPIIADTIRGAIEGHCANQHHWANVMHFRKTGALTFAAAIALLDPILFATYNTASGGGQPWKAYAPTAAGVERAEYTPLDGTSATTVVTHTLAGTGVAEALPASVSLVVTLRTALRGRSHRGRVYTGPYAEDSNTALGVPLGATLTGVQLQWADLITRLVGTGVSMVVASYKLATSENVTAVTTDSRWDTQRRRLNA